MSAGVSSGGGGHGSQSQDFELNLASIIDCFTVLISFMLITASFLSIGILDAGIAAGAAQATDTQAKPPAIQITLEIKDDQSIQAQITGKETKTQSLKDLAELGAFLKETKLRWTDVTSLSLQAAPNVEYQQVIRTMDEARKTVPNVLLGGF
jgi:biopolymer transport protein ExbD